MTTTIDDLATGDWVDADGIRTHYHDAGTGPAIVLLHGSGPGVSSWSNWHKLMPAMADRYRVVAIDYVGFGETERPDDIVYGPETWKRHVLATLDAIGVDRAVFVGNSMGGAITLRIARDHPDRVVGMVLMGSGGLPITSATPGLIALRAYTATEASMRDLIVNGFVFDAALATPELVAERFAASTKPGVHETYVAMFTDPKHQGDQHPLPEEVFMTLTMPALIVHGREDGIIPIANSWRMFELLPNATFHGLSRCGHWAQHEHPAEFQRLLEDFMVDVVDVVGD